MADDPKKMLAVAVVVPKKMLAVAIVVSAVMGCIASRAAQRLLEQQPHSPAPAPTFTPASSATVVVLRTTSPSRRSQEQSEM